MIADIELIILAEGLYTEKQLRELEILPVLPTLDMNALIINPLCYNLPSYRVAKVRQDNSFMYKVTII